MYDDRDLRDCCCSCHTGHAPCSYCTDTFTCDSCEDREYSAEVEENDYGFLCETCTDLYEQSKSPGILYSTAQDMFFIAGLLVLEATFHDILVYLIN